MKKQIWMMLFAISMSFALNTLAADSDMGPNLLDRLDQKYLGSRFETLQNRFETSGSDISFVDLKDVRTGLCYSKSHSGFPRFTSLASNYNTALSLGNRDEFKKFTVIARTESQFGGPTPMILSKFWKEIGEPSVHCYTQVSPQLVSVITTDPLSINNVSFRFNLKKDIFQGKTVYILEIVDLRDNKVSEYCSFWDEPT